MKRQIKLDTSDVLTDVLTSIRLQGKIFCYSELSAPWSLALPSGPFAHFHVIERGGGWIKLQGSKAAAIPLGAGDLVILSHGDSHELSDRLETLSAPRNKFRIKDEPGRHLLRHGGGGAETLLICGSFQFADAVANPLLSLLPPLIHIRGYRNRAGEWLELTVKLLAYEARHVHPGSETVITRLADIIFVQAVRAWIEDQPEDQGGWLGALRDRQIGSALGLVHREPERDWTVSSLAAAVGMSRSPFATRFTALVGEPPLTYLTRWRMHLAASLLQSGQLTIRDVAERAGYESEAAFSKAFKRRVGLAPRTYRIQNRKSDRTTA